MLSVKEIESYVSGLTYKPGWSFEVYEADFEGPRVRIVAEGLPNAYDLSDSPETVDLGVDSYLSPMDNTQQLGQWIAWRLERIESHEMREFLKHDGKMLYDPHIEGAAV